MNQHVYSYFMLKSLVALEEEEITLYKYIMKQQFENKITLLSVYLDKVP